MPIFGTFCHYQDTEEGCYVVVTTMQNGLIWMKVIKGFGKNLKGNLTCLTHKNSYTLPKFSVWPIFKEKILSKELPRIVRGYLNICINSNMLMQHLYFLYLALPLVGNTTPSVLCGFTSSNLCDYIQINTMIIIFSFSHEDTAKKPHSGKVAQSKFTVYLPLLMDKE